MCPGADAENSRASADVLDRQAQTLAQEQQRFGSLVQRAAYLVSIVDAQGTITYQSPALLHLLDNQLAERVGKPWAAAVHADDLAAVRPVLDALVAQPGETVRVEFRVRRRDQRWLWLEATVTNLFQDPDVRGFVFNFRDMTERKAAESALQERERTLRLALEAGRMAVWDWDAATNRITWSGLDHLATPGGWTEGAFGPDLDEALEAVHPDDRDRVRQTEETAAADGWTAFDSEYRIETGDGEIRWYHDRGIGVARDDSGRISRMVGVTMDITERKAAEEAIRESAESFASLFRDSAEAMVIHDGGTIIAANQEFAAGMAGVDPAQLVGRSLANFAAPDSLDFVGEQFRQEVDVPYDILARRADGSILPVEILERPIRYNGRWLRLMTGRDVTARYEAAAKLRESEERFRALVQATNDIIIIFDADGRLQYANPALERMLGYPESFYAERLRLDTVHPDDVDMVRRAWETVLSTPGSTVNATFRFRNAGDVWVWLDVTATNHLENPAIGGIVLNMSDVSEHKRLEAELRHLALHDALTGLPNRTLFADRLEHAFQRAQQQDGLIGVLFIDLDRFKLVNDGLGHAGGDALLRAVTRRVTSALGAGDTLARFGGDEFVALLENIASVTGAEETATRVLAALEPPFAWAGKEITIGVSIGVATSKPTHPNPDVLLREADAALYRAKASGRGRSALFVPGMTGDTPRRLTLESDLRWAVSRNELFLHFQPIVALATGQVRELEALLRWQHPAYGLVSPVEFIPIAETSGLIIPIGRWVLEEAIRQMGHWGAGAPAVAINLPPVQFREAGLAGEIAAMLARAGIDPGRLRVELTEHAFVEDIEVTRDTLEALRQLGVSVAIDDFGTGYSSLGYLRDLPVDTIKLDRSFVHGLGVNAGNLAIVEGMTSLAHVLGLTVTAEGIETVEQLNHLRAIGCDQGQGFLLGRPALVNHYRPPSAVPLV